MKKILSFALISILGLNTFAFDNSAFIKPNGNIKNYVKVFSKTCTYVKINKDVAIFNLENDQMKKKKYPYRKSDYGITINNVVNGTTNNTIYKKDNYIYYNKKL